ncbi:hypothetical protein ACFOSV_01500 [Algoriphagus namhaensis]|uniref:Uncharacterized protein n=1 Tax=Algoriphagus namhaensis TaxID=915353 RepID=A0ABV8ALD5_9BACT
MSKKELKDDSLFRHFEELGHESPSDMMVKNVLSTLAAKKPKVIYEPLISPLLMRIILGGLLIIFIGIVFMIPEDGVNYFDQNKLLTWSTPDWKIPQLKLENFPMSLNIAIYAFGIFCLFNFFIYQWQLKKTT